MELNKQEYDKYVKQITPTHSLGTDMLRAFDLPAGTDFGDEYDDTVGNGKGHRHDLDAAGADPAKRDFDRDECVSQDCEVGRRRGFGADYRVRQLGGGAGD